MKRNELQSLIRETINYAISEKMVFPKNSIRVSQLKKGDVLGGSGLEIVNISSGAMTPSGKVEVTVRNPQTGKEITKLWNKSTTVSLKENTPAPSKPKEKPDVAEPPVKSPDKPKPRRPLGNPDVKPKPKAEGKAEQIASKIADRFQSKK